VSSGKGGSDAGTGGFARCRNDETHLVRDLQADATVTPGEALGLGDRKPKK
jgi:hypothetical protein